MVGHISIFLYVLEADSIFCLYGIVQRSNRQVHSMKYCSEWPWQQSGNKVASWLIIVRRYNGEISIQVLIKMAVVFSLDSMEFHMIVLLLDSSALPNVPMIFPQLVHDILQLEPVQADFLHLFVHSQRSQANSPTNYLFVCLYPAVSIIFFP